MLFDPSILVQSLIGLAGLGVALATYQQGERRGRERPAAPVVVLTHEQLEIVLRAEQGRPSPAAEALLRGLAEFRRGWEETLAYSKQNPPVAEEQEAR